MVGGDELDAAVGEEDVTALALVVFGRERFGAAGWVPAAGAGGDFKEQDHIRGDFSEALAGGVVVYGV